MSKLKVVVTGLLITLIPLVHQAFADEFIFEESDRIIQVTGANFQFKWDLDQGGEISEILVHDGNDMLRVNGIADGYNTVPHYSFIDTNKIEYTLSNFKNTEYQLLYKKDDEAKFVTKGRAVSKDGKLSPWVIEQTFRVFKAGVVFCDIDISMVSLSRFELSKSSITFAMNEELAKNKFRWTYDKAWPEPGNVHATPFVYLSVNDSARYNNEMYPYAGANFGVGKNVFYSNHAEFVLENWETLGVKEQIIPTTGFKPLDGITASGCWFRYEPKRGMLFSWNLYEGKYPMTVESPYRYTNRWGLGVSGMRKTSKKETPLLLKNKILGSCIYHWVNWNVGDGRWGSKEWYPTNAQIDTMAGYGCDILLLHHAWMKWGGVGRAYRANYQIADRDEYKRVIDYCHSKGIKVGVYLRGLEYDQLDRDVSWFSDYLIKDYDGIYVDWCSFLYPPTPCYAQSIPIAGEKVMSYQPSKTHIPALANLLYTKKLRELVGENGFLIGHPGDKQKEPTTIAMTYYDAILIGDVITDREAMFLETTDKNIYFTGLVGNGTTIGLTNTRPISMAGESISFYAAFDNNAQLILGRRYGIIDLGPQNQPQLVLWQMFREVDDSNLTVYNPAIENKDIAKFSNPNFYGVIYRDESDHILLIASNFGERKSCKVEINFTTIEADGNYNVYELKGKDYDNYSKMKMGKCKDGNLKIGPFEQFEYRGYLLSKE